MIALSFYQNDVNAALHLPALRDDSRRQVQLTAVQVLCCPREDHNLERQYVCSSTYCFYA
jgi:hypothetical protein